MVCMTWPLIGNYGISAEDMESGKVHAAALKQVPSCEFFPMEAVRTNVIGTDNVLHAAIDAGVKRVDVYKRQDIWRF